MSLVLIAACDMSPKYVRPAPDGLPAQWPEGAAYPAASDQPAGMTWTTLVSHAGLRRVVESALEHNQDLAAAIANVASARAQYRIERSYQFPTLSADAGATIKKSMSGSSSSSNSYSGSVGVSGFEVDLWGRRKNLSQEAFEQYLASESGTKSTKLTVVSETITAYVTLASDKDLLALADEQARSGERTLMLTQDLYESGLVSGSDVADAQTILAQGRSDVAKYTTQIAQDRNALELLVGQSVPDTDLPASLGELDQGLAVPAAGMSSEVLLMRPDVVEAEHQLKAANFDIGAARAAFFPTISLTSALGFASSALSGLLSGNYFSLAPSVSVPLVGGTNKGNLAYSQAQRDYYVATYRKAVQSAFRDVADALARRGTIDGQRRAQSQLVTAAQKSYDIGYARYREGADSFLTALVAQRTLYSARQTEVATILADHKNRVALYDAIGTDETL